MCRTSRAVGMVCVVAMYFAAACSVQADTLLYVTDQQGGIGVIDASTLKVQNQISTGGQEPRGLALAEAGKYLLTANKATDDVSLIERATGAVIDRIKIGENPEFIRARGHFAYVTYEPKDADGGRAQVALVAIDQRKVIANWPSGHETEGLEFSSDGKYLLVTNEGDDTITVYSLGNGQIVRTINTADWGTRPRGIKRLPDGTGYVVSLEFSDKLLLLDTNFKMLKTVDSLQGPYGLAFDPAGKKLFVAAAKSEAIQVFNAHSLVPLASIPVGHRCWHFTFTPDGKQLFVACGRSSAVYAIDAITYKLEKIIDGFKMPWGIVAYPAANGTLDLQ